MDTATILGIIGGVGTVCGIFGISAYIGERAKHKAKTDLQKEEEERLAEEKAEREKSLLEIREIFKEEIKPINDKITALDEKLTTVEDGTLSTLRNDILTCYYRCVEKGYRNDYDLQNMDHMYSAYKELHGNSYVSDVYERFKRLAVKEEVKSISFEKPKKSTKKELVEAE